MKRVLLVIALALTMLLLSTGSALAGGPQPLPAAACNSGTANAADHGAQTQSGDETPHLHNFDGDSISACYHFNITFPPANSGLE
jgi:hypothetical protein